MSQTYPSTGQWAGPLRPPAPAPVLAAAKLMYAGATVSTVPLIIGLFYLADLKFYRLRWNGHSLTAAQLSHWRPLIITVAIVAGLVVPALWLWMARAVGRGRNWARILSTVLFGLATLQLAGNISDGVALVIIAVMTWLIGVAVVWLLWRPASGAFFKPQRFV
jgi:hypothetical protein